MVHPQIEPVAVVRSSPRLPLLLALLHGLIATSIVSARAEIDIEPAAIAAEIRSLALSDSADLLEQKRVDAIALRRFYESREFRPAWIGDVKSIEQATQALAALDRVDEDGLDPADYRIPPAAREMPTNAAEAATRDLLLTDAVLRYAMDLRTGRVAPEATGDEIALPPRRFDAVATLAAALDADDLAHFLADLAPPHPAYRMLKAALKNARAQLAASDPPRIPVGEEIKLDGNDARLPLLRTRLALDDSKLASAADGAKKGDLAEALRRFQARAGLEPDGRAGRKTLAILNIGRMERIAQIVANMERWRWMPRELEARHAVVNTADGTLQVIDGDRTVLTSKVVVGDEKHPSPILRAVASVVTVNPPWNVPLSIARKELLPKLRRDPSYLVSEDIILVNGPSGDLYGVNVNWRKVSADRFPFRLQQLPGPRNALGGVKLEMPNRFDVYLHDTPTKKLFARAQRDFSHGCIRVEQALALASFALTGDTAQAKDMLTAEIGTGNTRHLAIKRPLPVYILYWTAVVEADGTVAFRPDVYGRDQRLAAALAAHSKPAGRAASIRPSYPSTGSD